jgi:hypothetical protein
MSMALVAMVATVGMVGMVAMTMAWLLDAADEFKGEGWSKYRQLLLRR